MKKYLYTAIFVTGVIASVSYLKSELNKYKTLYNKELQNVEAYRQSNSTLEGKARQYQMTIDDLRNSNDSLDIKLASMIDELKIKDKTIETLQYQVNIISKRDTIVLSDTIFVKDVAIDTIIGDNWYNLNLKLKYPSTIMVSPTFVSEQYVIINNAKVYNKKPSKIFFIRWFQKKHNIVEVNIKEKNPYIKNKESKFIKVLK